MTYVDLHTHSTASDGTYAPADLVDLAAQNGLSAIALTDHDTIAGVAEAADRAKVVGIDFLPGIEISAEFPAPGTLHILGYGVDPHSPILASLTDTLIAGRDNRNPKIIEKLNAMGLSITMEEVQTAAGGAVVGRPHIAAVMLARGYVKSIKEAFDQYLAQGAPAYFDKERLTPRQAIDRIHQSGGVAVLAHPVQLRTTNDAELDRVVKGLVDLGLRGIEVFHADHREEHVRRYSNLARCYNLVQTGGSDFHGRNKPTISLGRAGNYRVPRDLFDRLSEAIRESRQPTKNAPGTV
jgi:predicted metal-dependent phosphoesterase TrpH